MGPLLFALGSHECVLTAKSRTMQRYPGELDFVVFFLDDGVFGGTARAIQFFFEVLGSEMANVGLSLQWDKCEVIPVAAGHHAVNTAMFEGCKINVSGEFKTLGAPIGSAGAGARAQPQDVARA